MTSLRILVVEDQDQKFLDVVRKLEERFQQEGFDKPTIRRSVSHTSAVLILQEFYCDIIILDLKIPFVDSEMPEFAASLAFLSYLKANSQFRPFKVLALTSFDEATIPDLQASDATVTVHKYSLFDTDWLDKLVHELRYVTLAKEGLMRYFGSSYDLDVLFVVARHDNEFVPIEQAIAWLAPPRSDSRLGSRKNLFGDIKSGDKILSSGLVCIQEVGLSVSAALVGSLIALYRPRFLIMLGMCCGLNDADSPVKAKIGDVMIANETACWDEGKYSDAAVSSDPFFNRSLTRVPFGGFRGKVQTFCETRAGETAKALKIGCKEFKLSQIEKSCEEEISKTPVSHGGLMLSGSSVVDSVKQIALIRKRFPSAVSLEMEAHSVYAAVDVTLGPKPNVVVIKGVADHGQGKKNKAAQKWASSLSYVAAKELIDWVEQSPAVG